MKKNERNSSIDAVRGVAIVLVMIGHVFVHNQMEDPYIYDFIKAVQMPLFMIISGYLCGQGRKLTEPKSYGRVMKKRMIAYLVPFFSWLLVLHPKNIFGALERIFFELDFGLWFLAVLFILTFMVYTAQLMAGVLRKKRDFLYELIFWGVYGALCLVLVLQILTGNSFLSPYLTIIYVPFYMLGYVYGDYGQRWSGSHFAFLKGGSSSRREITAMALLFFCTFLYLVITRNLNSMESKADTLIQMLASLLGSISIIYGVFRWKNGRWKALFAKIGCYTLEIYVIHYHFANILNFHNRQFDVYTLSGAGFVLLSFAAMSAVTFACIWLIRKSVWLNFLLFGKRG